MNTIVNKLLDVDKEARQILDEAQQYYDNTIRELSDEKQRMISEYEAKAKAHLEDIEKTENKNITGAAARIERRHKRLTVELDKVFLENRDKWEDELYKKCIGR